MRPKSRRVSLLDFDNSSVFLGPILGQIGAYLEPSWDPRGLAGGSGGPGSHERTPQNWLSKGTLIVWGRRPNSLGRPELLRASEYIHTYIHTYVHTYILKYTSIPIRPA